MLRVKENKGITYAVPIAADAFLKTILKKVKTDLHSLLCRFAVIFLVFRTIVT
jgi:hypothetical protein